MLQQRRFLPVALSVLWMAITPLVGCGYHFPGDKPVLLRIDATKPGVALHRATIQIDGDGAEERPLLARVLRERLTEKLAVASGSQADDGEGGDVTIRLVLKRVERTVQVEEKQRSTNQYRVVIRAVPAILVGGKAVAGSPWSEVRGWATYYAMPAATSNQASQQQAEIEAMNQLVDSLTALLLAQ
ncbi:MAG: hypothetical protein HQL60_01680 [Magnetococcales bacterium]|nr:hypothetical protein [Magnetococcales bacterium]